MTTVIAVKRPNGKVDLGWDSLVSPGGTSYPKVMQVNEQFWFGGAGRLRFLNIVQSAEVPAVHRGEFHTEEFRPLEYIITRVVPAWIEALENSYKRIPDQKEDWPWGVGIIVMKSRIFHIWHDFAVSEAEGNLGVGSGSHYALGAISAGKSVERALEIASELDELTGGKIHTLKGL